ncbi:sigma-54 dependent transcriptional regulator [Asticcacaulis sp. ZE23SCel15]|uniref:sigma-54-dependent transcriptional regulator n=1 Tax=Asticcacaulis sp. ZE23SCel15 TaxID=3059027 RepID=UPI00265F6301|nr:sigma-54 dependent transcriptional regulator [Asticcacaulis sp. ZE23SCel15]WKL57585.1 sigma-54 dependent transcriptional regulator [Asticcacaulis sp. ZE23SCel15]
MTGNVIFIDDDADLLSAQIQALELDGFLVRGFSNGPDALKVITSAFDGVIVTDVRMPRMDGLTLFKRVQAIDAELPVILMTGHGDVPMAVQALKDGAYDFISKPFARDDLIQSVRRALQTRDLVMENRQLRQAHAALLDRENPAQNLLLGESPAMTYLKQVVVRVAEADVDALITGDTGVGKERVGRALHALSTRKNRPFVHVGCATLTEDSFQAELFGIEAGHRPGAARVIGRFERANKGTLFLDEVEGLSLSQQARLLRVLETREIWPVGSESPRSLDIRVVAATRTDLTQSVKDEQFRADLYYRLSGVSLRVPPLSERGDDIRLLFQHFLLGAATRLNRPPPKLTQATQAYLSRYDWPGNVRELEQFAELCALGLDSAHLPADSGALGLAEQVSQYEEAVLRETLSQYAGNVREVIAALKLPRKTFYDKITRYGIALDDYRG